MRRPLRKANDSSLTGSATVQRESLCASIVTLFSATPAARRDAEQSSADAPDSCAGGGVTLTAGAGLSAAGLGGGKGGSASFCIAGSAACAGDIVRPASGKMSKQCRNRHCAPVFVRLRGARFAPDFR